MISSRLFQPVHKLAHDPIERRVPHILAFEDACEGVGLALHDLDVEAGANERVGKRLEGEEPAIGVLWVLNGTALSGGGHPKLGHDVLNNKRRGTHLNCGIG